MASPQSVRPVTFGEGDDTGGLKASNLVAPNFGLGTLNFAGLSGNVVPSNSGLAIFQTTVPTTIEPDDSAAAGSAAFAARRDHVHGIVTAAPAFVFTTANAEGDSTSFLRANAELAIFDDAGSSPLPLETVAADGSNAFASRNDHVHEFPETLQSDANSATLKFTDTGTNGVLTNSLGGLTITWPATGLQLGTTSGSATLNRMAIGRAVSSSIGFAIQGRYSAGGAALNFLAENINAGDTIFGMAGNTRGRGIAGFSQGNTFKGCITSMQLRSTGHTAAAFIHYDTQMTVNLTDATSNLTNRYGLLMEPNPDPAGSPAYGAVANTYGVRVNDIAFGTNRWAFYSVADKMFIGNKIAFTQTDENEYIDSLTDGELDLEGTTSVNLRIGGAEALTIDAALISAIQDFDFAEGMSIDVETVTGNTTLSDDDFVILCNSSSAFTITLPAASSNTGRLYHIKNISTGAITVDGNSSETIDGGTTAALSAQFESISIACDGSNWHII